VDVAANRARLVAWGMGDNSHPEPLPKHRRLEKDDALEIEVLESNEQRYASTLTRCPFTRKCMRSYGSPNSAAVFSCNRDAFRSSKASTPMSGFYPHPNPDARRRLLRF